MKYLVSLLLLFAAHSAFAQNAHGVSNTAFTKRPLTIVENKGQVKDQYGKPRHDIQYKTGSGALSVFIGNGQLHYQWSKAENKRPDNKHGMCGRRREAGLDTATARYSMYRLDMELEGANPDAVAVPADKQAYYENYHTAALNTKGNAVCAYNKITYKNIYPHIDWILYIKDNKLEYDFIVNPGGNVTDIKIKYNGATDIVCTEGSIKITTPFGDVSERNLYAYEQGSGKPTAANFKQNKKTVGFTLQRACDTRTAIIIDPTLAWGTYFGGENRDGAFGTACDKYSNVFVCGFTESVDNIATAGAYQTVYAGEEDAFVAKYSNSGALSWATYYGGESQDVAYAVVCDSTGNAYITGQTHSATGIATTGSHQAVCGGQYDAFLAKFSITGTFEWATYFGGNSNDDGSGLTCDASGNIYLCGETGSANNISTAGSYQDTIPVANIACAFLAKFNTLGDIVWSTYFGLKTGTSDGINCYINKAGDIYISGDVGDTGVYATPGCYKSTDGYGGHCFLAKFDSACHLIWSTYFGGNSAEDYMYGITCDDSSNVYIIGLTTSDSGIASAGAYQTDYGGGDYDAFVAKFNDTGALQWSTYYGGDGNDQGAGIAADGMGNVYITGSTTSDNNIATPGSYQATKRVGLDAFITKFNSHGALISGTYYGGNSEDVATGVAIDGNSNIYIAGYTASADYISTLNNYPDSVTDSFEAFLVKFDTSATIVKSVTSHINSLQLYPIPNNGNFTITGEFADGLKMVSIEILTAAGQIIYVSPVMLQNGKLEKIINLKLAAGIYIMRVNTTNETKSIKFTVQ